MAETGERPDIVPYTLGQLSDVDSASAPAVGDTLTWDGAEWRAGGIAGEFGPALSLWKGQYDGANLADYQAIYATWIALDPSPTSGYETYPGTHPPMGSWVAAYSGTLRWLASEPGLYHLYASRYARLSAAPSADAALTWSPLSTILLNSIWGVDNDITFKPAVTVNQRTESITVPISQGMIDAGIGGVDVGAPFFATGGAERVNLLSLNVIIERHSPGAAFNYYGDI